MEIIEHLFYGTEQTFVDAQRNSHRKFNRMNQHLIKDKLHKALDYYDDKFLEHQEAIIEHGDAYFMYRLAKESDQCDRARLEDAVIECGESVWMVAFAENVRNANIERLLACAKLTGDFYDEG